MLIDNTDRRRHKRMPIDDCPITFRQSATDIPSKGKGKNLSAGGILFYTTQAVNVGDLLQINVEPLVNVSPPLTAVLEVIRVYPADVGTGFEVAGSFKEILRN